MGDYNLSGAHLFSNDEGLNFVGKLSESFIFDCFTLNEFSQYNTSFNKSGSLLDLVFSNIKNTFVSSVINDYLVSVDNYHPPLKVSFELNKNNIIHDTLTNSQYDFRKGNYPAINHTLNSIDWHLLYNYNKIETACNTLYEIIFDVIDKFVPKKITTLPKFPHWLSHELK